MTLIKTHLLLVNMFIPLQEMVLFLSFFTLMEVDLIELTAVIKSIQLLLRLLHLNNPQLLPPSLEKQLLPPSLDKQQLPLQRCLMLITEIMTLML